MNCLLQRALYYDSGMKQTEYNFEVYVIYILLIFVQKSTKKYNCPTKAVNREDKRSRRYRDRDLAKFERSRRYRDRYRCPGKKSRRGRDRDLVFRDPTPPRKGARSLIANR